jgi:hypothetical protein
LIVLSAGSIRSALVRQVWEPEELITCWTLVGDECRLCAGPAEIRVKAANSGSWRAVAPPGRAGKTSEITNKIVERMPGGFVTGFAPRFREPHELIESPR